MNFAPSPKVFPQNVVQPSRLGFVFGPWGDFVSFGVPLLFGALLCLFPFFRVGGNPVSALWFLIFLHYGHVLATAVPIYRAGDQSTKIFSLLVLIASFFLCFLTIARSPALFLTLNTYIAIVHAIRQHYGWLRYSQRRPATDFQSRFEQIVFWNLILFPLLHWHSENSSFGRSYFYANDLIAPFLPGSVDHILHFIFWAINFAYVAFLMQRFFVRRECEVGRIAFMIMTWIWFYVGICVLQHSLFYFVVSVSCHGLSYHYFICRGFAPSPRRFSQILWIRPLLYFVCFAIGGWFLQVGYTYFQLGESDSAQSLPLILGRSALGATSLAHYFIDGVIWKNQARLLFNGIHFRRLDRRPIYRAGA